jgi:hypothetical protein
VASVSSPTPLTPEYDLEALRRARAVARELWKRRLSVGQIEQQLRRDGFDAATSRLTARHLFEEVLEQQEHQERNFVLGGAGVLAAGMTIVTLAFIFGPAGMTYGGAFLALFGLLSMLRGFWIRGRLRATRNLPWMKDAGSREGNTQ